MGVSCVGSGAVECFSATNTLVMSSLGSAAIGPRVNGFVTSLLLRWAIFPVAQFSIISRPDYFSVLSDSYSLVQLSSRPRVFNLRELIIARPSVPIGIINFCWFLLILNIVNRYFVHCASARSTVSKLSFSFEWSVASRHRQPAAAVALRGWRMYHLLFRQRLDSTSLGVSVQRDKLCYMSLREVCAISAT